MESFNCKTNNKKRELHRLFFNVLNHLAFYLCFFASVHKPYKIAV